MDNLDVYLTDLLVSFLKVEDALNLAKAYPHLKNLIIKRKEKELIKRVAPSKNGLFILDQVGELKSFGIDVQVKEKYKQIFSTVSGNALIGLKEDGQVDHIFGFSEDSDFRIPNFKTPKNIWANVDNFSFILNRFFYLSTNMLSSGSYSNRKYGLDILKIDNIIGCFILLTQKGELIKYRIQMDEILATNIKDFVTLANEKFFDKNLVCLSEDHKVTIIDTKGNLVLIPIPEIIQGQVKYLTSDDKIVLFTLFDGTVWNLNGEKLEDNVLYAISRSEKGHIYIMKDGQVKVNSEFLPIRIF